MFINKITFLSDSVEAPGERRQQSFKLGKSRLLPAPPPLIQFLNLKIAMIGWAIMAETADIHHTLIQHVLLSLYYKLIRTIPPDSRPIRSIVMKTKNQL